MPTATSKRPTDASMAIEMLREHSLATLAQQELERRIISGEIAAGTKLNEVEVAAALGVSRGPVREAFSALSQAGLVRVEKNRGVFVRQVSLEEANEFYEVRAALEGPDRQAGRAAHLDRRDRAAARGGAAHAPDAEGQARRRVLRAQRRVPRPAGARRAQQRAAGPLPRRGQPARPVPPRHHHPRRRRTSRCRRRSTRPSSRPWPRATSSAPKRCSPNTCWSAASGCMPRWAPPGPRPERSLRLPSSQAQCP